MIIYPAISLQVVSKFLLFLLKLALRAPTVYLYVHARHFTETQRTHTLIFVWLLPTEGFQPVISRALSSRVDVWYICTWYHFWYQEFPVPSQ